MALTKQSININFAQGLETKADPWQLPPGKFLNLVNMVFDKNGLLKKRNGFSLLATIPPSTYITTLDNNLLSIGDSINSYNSNSQTYVSKGVYTPLELSVVPLIRNSSNQTQGDSAISLNGLVCAAYTESNGSTTTIKYVISNSQTGQSIVSPTPIPVSSGTPTGSPRVYVLGQYFVILFTNVISSTSHLQYIAISCNNPTVVYKSNTDIASAYISFSTLSYDAVVNPNTNTMFIAYNSTTSSQRISVASLTSQFVLTTVTTNFVGYKATIMNISIDLQTQASGFVYLSFYSSSSSTGFVAAMDQGLNIVMAPVEIISSGTILNLTASANSGVCTVFAEVSNAYSYDASIATNYIQSITVTPLGTRFTSHFSSGASSITASSAAGLVTGQYLVDNTTPANITAGTSITVSGTTLSLSNNTAGNSAALPGDSMTTATIGSAITVIRSVGLASKAFLLNGNIYFLASYQSPYQNTYFLVNGTTSTQASPVIVSKLAYENGGGYLTLGLPNVSIAGTTAYIPYLYKDLIEPLATAPTSQQTVLTGSGIYSQTGLYLSQFDFNTQGIDSAEMADTLHISGGFLWMYDGVLPVEHNFFLWPDSVEASLVTVNTVTPTGTFSSLSTTITVSSATGIQAGMSIADSTNSGYIPSGTIVTSISGSTLTISQATTHSGSGDTLSISANMSAQQYYYQVIYSWTDNQGNIHRSAPSIPVSVTQTLSGVNSITLNIPTLRLTYKNSSNPVVIDVYRWSAAQQTYYQVSTSLTNSNPALAPLQNSTTSDSVSFTDLYSDASIAGNSIIYTNGGVVEDVNGAASNIFTLFDDRLWLVDAEDPNLLWYSKQVIESTPVEMSDLFTFYVAPSEGAQGSTGNITALAPMDDKLIIFKQNAIYYINGTGPDNTGANSQYPGSAIFVTSAVGCTNPNSLVLTPNGLMFQSSKGIWLLGRNLGTEYIGSPVEAFNSYTVQSAVSVPATNQVRFTLNNYVTLMYDYFANQWGTFNFQNIDPVSSCIFQNYHSFIDINGNIYQETPNVYLDGTQPTLISLTSSWLNLAGVSGYERIYDLILTGQYYSPHKLLVGLAYDYAAAPSQQSTISPLNYNAPWGGDSTWGLTTPWGGNAQLEQWRVHTQRQTCQAFQISIQEVYDPSYGVSNGVGLTLSNMNIRVGIKKSVKPIPAAQAVG